MSRYELIRWSGLAGLASGFLIIAGAFAMLLAEPVVSGTLFVSGNILLFFLLTGVYGTHHAYTGILGLLGYVLSIIGNALFITIQAASSFVISRVDVPEEFFPAAAPATGMVFAAGLLLFAITNTRVRALPAWPGWLMFLGVALNLALPFIPGELPDLVSLVPPVMLGLGAIGFGYSMRQN